MVVPVVVKVVVVVAEVVVKVLVLAVLDIAASWTCPMVNLLLAELVVHLLVLSPILPASVRSRSLSLTCSCHAVLVVLVCRLDDHRQISLTCFSVS